MHESDNRYKRKHGKLVYQISLPVDERLRGISDRAKAQGFDFNQWLRDLMDERISEVERAVG
jgi:hypothetical protein